MLRKKVGKQPTNPPPIQSKPSTAIKPPVSAVQAKPAFAKIESKPALDKQKISKQKVAELVANRFREARKENEIVNKISAQMLNVQKRRFKQFLGLLQSAIKLTKREDTLKQSHQKLKDRINQFSKTNFKQTDYL